VGGLRGREGRKGRWGVCGELGLCGRGGGWSAAYTGQQLSAHLFNSQIIKDD
jgi:hypothetical protein